MKAGSKAFARRSDGFTLIEVLMALCVIGLLAVGAYDALRAGMMRVDRWSEEISVQGDLRVAMALLARDVRSAYLSSEDEATYFTGSPHEGPNSNRMNFTRRALGTQAGQDPVWEVGYFVEPGAVPGTWDLCRRWQQNADGVSMDGGTVRHLLSGVTSFQVQYFDGNKWNDEWNWDYERKQAMQGIRGLPLFVRVLLKTADMNTVEPPPWIIPVMSSVINRANHAI